MVTSVNVSQAKPYQSFAYHGHKGYLCVFHLLISITFVLLPIYYVCIYFFLHNIVLRVRNKCIYYHADGMLIRK